MCVCGLGNRKDRIVGARIRRASVEAFPGSVRYGAAMWKAGILCAVVSASANCHLVLRLYQRGELVGRVPPYRDVLLMFLLKKRDPSYRDSARLEVSGAGDEPIQVEHDFSTL